MREAQSPLWGEWPWSWFRPNDYRSYSFTSLPHPLNQEHQRVAGPTQRTGGRPREACGEGGTTVGANLLPGGPRPTLSPGHRPFLPAERSSSAATLPCAERCACCTGLKRYFFRSGELSKDNERVRRLLTRNPFPYDPWGFGYSPVAFRILSLLPDLTIRKKCRRVQGRDGSLMLAPYFRCSLIGDCFKFPCKFPGKLVPDYSQTSKRTGRLLCLLLAYKDFLLIRQHVRVEECQHSCVSECSSGRVFECTSAVVEECVHS